MRQRAAVDPVKSADIASAQLRTEADARAREILLQAQDEAARLRTSAEDEHRGRRAEIQRQEKRLQQKEENLDRKLEEIDQRERTLQSREREIDGLEREADELRLSQTRELEQLSGLTMDEAREVIVAQVEQDVRDACARRARELELEAAEHAEHWARQIIGTAIQRYSSDQVTESTVSVVHIPNEEMKGRIIGREGRNIRALEAATGIDLIVDDTPDAVTLSGFDPVRREIARLALTKLVTDGRIHPARIEEIVGKAKQEVEAHIRQEGETAAYEAGVHGLHPEVVKMMGKMRFRTSYGQNQLQHSIETAHLASMMAAELGADVAQVRRASFLHDIGKVMTLTWRGRTMSSAQTLSGASAEIACLRGCRRAPRPRSRVPVYRGGAVAGRRCDLWCAPRARRESVEHYVKRLEALRERRQLIRGRREVVRDPGRARGPHRGAPPTRSTTRARCGWPATSSKRIEETLQYPGRSR